MPLKRPYQLHFQQGHRGRPPLFPCLLPTLRQYSTFSFLSIGKGQRRPQLFDLHLKACSPGASSRGGALGGRTLEPEREREPEAIPGQATALGDAQGLILSICKISILRPRPYRLWKCPNKAIQVAGTTRQTLVAIPSRQNKNQPTRFRLAQSKAWYQFLRGLRSHLLLAAPA